MTNKSKTDNSLAVDELVFLENHIKASIDRIKHNGEYAESKQEKLQVIIEVQLLERILEYARQRKNILEIVRKNAVDNDLSI